MTEEAQRIAIAEACGAEFRELVGVMTKKPKGVFVWFFNTKLNGWMPQCICSHHVTKAEACLPDYLNDRNAMWDAAESAGEATIKAMRFWLFTICGEMKAHHASAAQEAEAFLRAKGLWVE